MIETNDLALVMVVLFLLIGVIYRTAMQLKATGDISIRLSSKLKNIFD